MTSLNGPERARFFHALNANPDAGPQELIRTVRKQIDRFAGDAPRFDDITMLAFKYYGRQ